MSENERKCSHVGVLLNIFPLEFRLNITNLEGVENSLQVLAISKNGDDHVLDETIYFSILYAEKGDYEMVNSYKSKYDQLLAESKIRFEKGSIASLLKQSHRTAKDKQLTELYIQNIASAETGMRVIVTDAWTALQNKDIQKANALITSSDYKKYHEEMHLNIDNWIELETSNLDVLRNIVFTQLQNSISFTLVYFIMMLAVLLFVLFAVRTFVAERDRFYELIYNTSQDAMMTLEGPDWKFTSGNPMALRLFNVKDKNEFMSLSLVDLSPEKQEDGQLSSEKAKMMIERGMKEGRISFRWLHKEFNGNNFHADVLMSRIDEKGKSYLQAIVRKMD